MRFGRNFAAGLLLVLSICGTAGATVIPILNPSFELPTVTLAQVASPFVDNWVSDGPSKLEFPPGSGFFVNTNVGIFPNTPSSSPDSIDNVDALQAAFMGAQTGNELTQALTTNFQAGQTYTLTVAVAHSFGQPPDSTAAVRLALYYLDGTQRKLVASRDVFNGATTALSANHLLDFSAVSPTLLPSDPAVGQPIHVLLTTNGPVGGFFDLDNVRLTAVPEPSAACLIVGAGLLLAGRRRRA